MADRPKLPPAIVVLNIIMVVLVLAICALAFALAMTANIDWTPPTLDSSSSAPVSSGGDDEPVKSAGDDAGSDADHGAETTGGAVIIDSAEAGDVSVFATTE